MSPVVALLLGITAASAALLTGLLLMPRRDAGDAMPLGSKVLLAMVAGAAFVAGFATGVLA
jgi:hypothetical protein